MTSFVTAKCFRCQSDWFLCLNSFQHVSLYKLRYLFSPRGKLLFTLNESHKLVTPLVSRYETQVHPPPLLIRWLYICTLIRPWAGPRARRQKLNRENKLGFYVVTVQLESVFGTSLRRATQPLCFCAFVNVIDKAEMPGLCVFLAVSCPAAEQKRWYFRKHCADVRHTRDLAASNLMHMTPRVTGKQRLDGFVMGLKEDLCHLTMEMCHVLLNTCCQGYNIRFFSTLFSLGRTAETEDLSTLPVRILQMCPTVDQIWCRISFSPLMFVLLKGIVAVISKYSLLRLMWSQCKHITVSLYKMRMRVVVCSSQTTDVSIIKSHLIWVLTPHSPLLIVHKFPFYFKLIGDTPTGDRAS